MPPSPERLPKAKLGRGDESVQRALNATAPTVDRLVPRIFALFRPHRATVAMTMLLVLVGAGLSVFPPLLTQKAFDEGLFPTSGRPDIPVLMTTVGLMAAIFAVTGVLGVLQTYTTAAVGTRVMGALRDKLYRHLQELDLGFFSRTKSGVIQSRLQNDVGGVAKVLTNTVSKVLGNIVTVIAALITMIALDPKLTVVAAVLTPILVFVQRRLGKAKTRIATETQESMSELSAITHETLTISGVQLAKSFNRQETEIRRYEEENARLTRLQIRRAMGGEATFAVVSFLLSCLPAAVYLVSAYLITDGTAGLTAGTIVAFTAVQARVLNPLVALMRVALDLQTSKALFARVFEYLDLEPVVQDRPGAAKLSDDSLLGHIEFDRVTFRYSDAAPEEHPTLDAVSLTIEPGQYVAFVGPSGAGKSTIASLIPRFYDVTSGRIWFAGTDLRDLEHDSLMERIGTVSQDIHLFHASIGENLHYARPGLTQADLEWACRQANIHERIMSFPDGYDTIVGERGFRLSGGEKQRIAIARVLLKDPAVLILDEATSALDTVSEAAVQEALDAASHGRTTIAIAHRLSTVVSADRIFVIDDGRIVESGSHDELLAIHGLYAQLYRQQAGEELKPDLV